MVPASWPGPAEDVDDPSVGTVGSCAAGSRAAMATVTAAPAATASTTRNRPIFRPLEPIASC